MEGGQERTERLVAEPADAGQRLDRVLAARLPAYSRSRLQALIRAGRVTIAGRTVVDPAETVNAGAELVLAVPPPTPAEPRAEPIPLVIVHEDSDLLVLDKPAGLVVHPAAGHDAGTLVNALIAHCGDSLSGIGGVKRPGIVHRLDKDTSGLLVVAKNDRAHRRLADQFADHGRTGPLERAYLALVWGAPTLPSGTVDAPLDRDPRNRERRAVRPGGKPAITHWRRLSVFAGEDGRPLASLLECMLETGRTHQIRAHLAHIGHPLLGDTLYGTGFRSKASRLPPAAADALVALGRQALHAARLGFSHPRTGEILRFSSDMPPDMRRLAEALTKI